MKKLVIRNRRSGQSSPALDWYFTNNNFEHFVIEMDEGVDIDKAISGAIEKGCEVVVAAGGDGTVNTVVNSLMKVDQLQRPKMAILPLGTANDFAGTLGIPDAIDEAMAMIDSDQYVPVDVVRIIADGFSMYYANVAAGGNSVRVSEEMTDELKSRWGAFCYIRGGINVLTDLKSFRIIAELDADKLEPMDSWAVLVANGRTNAGRIVVAPEASPVDGLIDVIIIRDGTAIDLIELVSNAVLGNYLECEQVIHRQVKRFVLHSEPGMRFTIDGEVINQEPVEFVVVPGAIQMCVSRQLATQSMSYAENRIDSAHRSTESARSKIASDSTPNRRDR